MTSIRNSAVALAQNLLARTGAILPPTMTIGLRRAANWSRSAVG
jgi:hypothetical protein